MFIDWGIEPSRRGHIVTDGGSNVKSGAELALLIRVYYFLHQLHLCVKDAIEAQRAVHDVLANTRRIATHFNKSTKARAELKRIQVIRIETLHLQLKLQHAWTLGLHCTYYPTR